MEIKNSFLKSTDGQELCAKLFQSSGEGIMLFNKNGAIEMLNPRAEDMFGYSEDELLGKAVEDIVPVDLRKMHKKQRSGYINKPAPRSMGQGLDLKGLKKDKTTFPIEISLNYFQHKDDMFVVAFITDISVRKENEQIVNEQRKKLEEYANELEEKVKIRTNELEHLNLGLQSQIQERKLAEQALKKSLKDLERAEKEILISLEKEKELGTLKSRFVSMASHEFRTPLTTILSSANLLKQYTESDQQPAREKHVGRIKKSVENLTGILNDFLNLEKLESGLQQVKIEKIEFSELFEEVTDEIRPMLKPGQEIVVDLKVMSIASDEHILKNILLNLLSNASKYSSEKDTINLKTSGGEEQVLVQVVDHGIGIPEEEQQNMFGRFFRAGNVTNIQGTGLGLNIVQKYIELLDGKISFESEEGKGSTFTVTLKQ